MTTSDQSRWRQTWCHTTWHQREACVTSITITPYVMTTQVMTYNQTWWRHTSPNAASSQNLSCQILPANSSKSSLPRRATNCGWNKNVKYKYVKQFKTLYIFNNLKCKAVWVWFVSRHPGPSPDFFWRGGLMRGGEGPLSLCHTLAATPLYQNYSIFHNESLRTPQPLPCYATAAQLFRCATQLSA